MEVTMAKTVLTVVGFAELTAANSKLFRNKVGAALNGHTVVEIDLSRTTIMDCAGVGALIALRHLIRGGNGVVRLMNPTSPVQQMLDLVRAGQILEIVTTRPMVHPWFASHRFFTFELAHFFGLSLPNASWGRSRLIANASAQEKCPPEFTLSGGAATDRRRQAQQTRRRRTGRELQNGRQTAAASHEQVRHPQCRWSHPLCLAEGLSRAVSG
jgi:anti-anti-sigma factor